MENFEDIDEIDLREQELRSYTSETLLDMFGKCKLFQGDIANEASAVACDIDIDVRIIRKILLERMNINNGGEKNAKNIKRNIQFN